MLTLRKTSPSDLVNLTLKKLGTQTRREYLPPGLDRLYERLEVDDDHGAQEDVQLIAWSFFQALRRMTVEERGMILQFLRLGCPTNLPDNVHINVDLLRRHTGKSIALMKRLLGGLQSLGFECTIRESSKNDSNLQGTVLGESDYFELDWSDLRGADFPPLVVAYEMIQVTTEYYCEQHGTESLERLDFSQLSHATFSKESEH